jgi:hypothetical protein
MKTTTDGQYGSRFWGLGALSVLLSAGAAFSYLHSMGYGIAAGDLIGLRGREVDVAFAAMGCRLVDDGRVLSGSFESRR